VLLTAILLMCRFKLGNLPQSDVCKSNVTREAHKYVVAVAHKPKFVKFLYMPRILRFIEHLNKIVLLKKMLG
jgi:hypothetical protein